MVDVRIYAEGGGDGSLYDTLFRKGWSEFFKAAGLAGKMPRVVRGKGRQRTYDLFRMAVYDPAPNTLPLLLVDSEGPVDPAHGPWQHLKRRDGWDQPPGTTDHDVFLMVQMMETWFVADRNALQRYFGARFNENALPRWPDLESVPRNDVLTALQTATARCATGYAKGKVSYNLLSEVDPGEVERACPAAKRLLARLRTL